MVDTTNLNIGELSAHMLPDDEDLETVDDILEYIENNKYEYDGTGDGESFSVRKRTKIVYSDGWLNIIQG